MPHTKTAEAETAVETGFREEFDTLRTQVSDLLQSLKSKAEATSDNLESTVGRYQDKAGQKLHDVYEAGNTGINDVSDHIRKNPVASVLIAFGVGYGLFKVLGQGK